ncbi:MAG: ABC transporter substrate-binding protein [Chlorobi bacterium]|nr:ABC transporter substrate-binding protein [Chlorobiota bacterium]
MLLILLVWGIAGCGHKRQQQDFEKLFTDNEQNLKSEIRFAKGFDIYRLNGITKVVVYLSGDENRKAVSFYILNKKKEKHFSGSSNIFSGAPGKAAVFSATQLAAFEKLGIQDKVIGVSEAAYIKSPYFRNRLIEKKIFELAGSGNFYTEKTMTVHPSVIFYTPYSVNDMHAMEITGIPLVPFFDYMETSPLGRAEWIKFTAAFFNKQKTADSIFHTIVTEYDHYKQLADTVKDRPTVFTDKYFNGQWFVAGGKSYTAAFFTDAGAGYIWKDDTHTASFPLEYEVVYQKARDADYWRIILSYGEKPSYRALAEENELYRHFKAFKKHQVIFCAPEKTAYFENSPLEPQIVLADLIKVFHPELLPDYQPKYFKLMR